MKCDIFYLSLHEDSDEFSCFKSLLAMLTSMYDDATSTWHYIYAITDNKKFSEKFESTHDMKLFTKVSKKLSKETYDELVKHNTLAVLRKYIIDKDKYIVCTKNEEVEIEDTFEIYLNCDLMENTEMVYNQFKTKYIKALDMLGYCTSHRVNGEDCDYYTHNLSYGCSAEGYIKTGLSIKANIASMYIKLYALLLKKDGDLF